MPKPGGTIYAIGMEGTALVKIGSTTLPIQRRLAQHQVGQPFALYIVATIAVESDRSLLKHVCIPFSPQSASVENGLTLPSIWSSLKPLSCVLYSILRRQKPHVYGLQKKPDSSPLPSVTDSRWPAMRGASPSKLCRRL